MSIRNCRFNCKFDPDTRELLCPEAGWVERCPKEVVVAESATESEVRAEILGANYPMIRTEDGEDYYVGYCIRINAERILSAHEREIAAKDVEIARLKAALKPVMELCIGDENTCTYEELQDDMGCALGAVREAQRIYKEGENKG